MSRRKLTQVLGICLLQLLLVCCAISAQVRVSASLDSANYLIGDRIALQLSIEHPYGTTVLWDKPAIVNADLFEKLSESGIDSIRQKDFLTENKTIILTTFDTGVLRIPAITCFFRNNGTTDSAFTIPLSVHVATVAVDTSEGFKPMKPIYGSGDENSIQWLWLIPVASVLVIGGAAWYWWNEKRKRKMVPASVTDNRLPHEKALDGLKEIERSELWKKQPVKNYYSTVTQVLREYIEKGLHLPALENTSYEIIYLLKKEGLDATLIQQLASDLSLADMVKFAKAQPSEEDHLRLLSTAENFIEKTKPVPVNTTVAEGPAT